MINIKRYKKLIIAAACLLAAMVLLLIILNGVVMNTKKYIKTAQNPGSGYDCILVLGCGVVGDRPSHMLEDRLLRGIELYKKGVAPKLLLTGDNGSENYNELAVMRAFVLERGVPAEDIFLDYAGFSTYESMYRAKEVFKVEKPLIVTQKYHLYRAIYDARAFGLDACGVDADLRPYAGQTMRDIREILARIKDIGYCIFKPLPKYLGEAIPVSGTGNCEP